MEVNEMIGLALTCGFHQAAVIPSGDIVFDPSFRPYCAENLCGQYGVNYACPPDCGSPEHMARNMTRHGKALVLSSKWHIPDYTDKAALKNGKLVHNRWMLKLRDELQRRGMGEIVMGGAGNCALCSPCAIVEGKPCRFPEKRYSCLSAYCVNVMELARRAGMDFEWNQEDVYYYGILSFD